MNLLYFGCSVGDLGHHWLLPNGHRAPRDQWPLPNIDGVFAPYRIGHRHHEMDEGICRPCVAELEGLLREAQDSVTRLDFRDAITRALEASGIDTNNVKDGEG